MKTFKQFIDESTSIDEISLVGSDKHQPGIYTSHVTSGKGKKRVTTYHEVHANSHADAQKIIADRHRDMHKLSKYDVFHVSTQYRPPDLTHGPKAKPPHRDSAEQKFRDEMQKRYDSLGYKGD